MKKLLLKSHDNVNWVMNLTQEELNLPPENLLSKTLQSFAAESNEDRHQKFAEYFKGVAEQMPHDKENIEKLVTHVLGNG